MPAVYAHECFGRAVAAQLDGEVAEVIRKYDASFQIGLQGPDIFFFFGAHTDNPVVRFGEHLHNVSAAPFFANAPGVIRQKGRMSREYAYLCGFVCHFILDSECHPYVEEMIKETGVQHLEIEEEFEKLLLKEDGKDPIGFPVATLVPTDPATARAISKRREKGIYSAWHHPAVTFQHEMDQTSFDSAAAVETECDQPDYEAVRGQLQIRKGTDESARGQSGV